jgi:hypothetical protein
MGLRVIRRGVYLGVKGVLFVDSCVNTLPVN